MLKRIISMLLVVTMTISMVPSLSITVHAKMATQMTEAEAWAYGVDVFMAWYNLNQGQDIIIKDFHANSPFNALYNYFYTDSESRIKHITEMYEYVENHLSFTKESQNLERDMLMAVLYDILLGDSSSIVLDDQEQLECYLDFIGHDGVQSLSSKASDFYLQELGKGFAGNNPKISDALIKSSTDLGKSPEAAKKIGDAYDAVYGDALFIIDGLFTYFNAKEEAEKYLAILSLNESAADFLMEISSESGHPNLREAASLLGTAYSEGNMNAISNEFIGKGMTDFIVNALVEMGAEQLIATGLGKIGVAAASEIAAVAVATYAAVDLLYTGSKIGATAIFGTGNKHEAIYMLHILDIIDSTVSMLYEEKRVNFLLDPSPKNAIALNTATEIMYKLLKAENNYVIECIDTLTSSGAVDKLIYGETLLDKLFGFGIHTNIENQKEGVAEFVSDISEYEYLYVNAPLNRYSKFAENNIYRIYLDSNGGEWENIEAYGLEKPLQTKISTIPVTITKGIPTREGYRFDGWSISASAKEAEYKPGDKYINDGNVTLYAVWKQDASITYNANGGTGAPASHENTEGPTELSTTVPTRTGYTFLGWDENPKVKEPTYPKKSDGSPIIIDKEGNITLYAIWQAGTFDTVSQSGTCGTNVNWALTIDGELLIYGTGAMNDYQWSSTPSWYSYNKSIKSVIIEDGVTSIGNYAFWYCSSLTSVTIPDSVTCIGDSAFSECSSLTSITIPDSVTSIGDYAFCYCSSLTSVEIGDSVTSIGEEAFSSCSSLISVTIPDSVTSIGDSAFSGCSSLTSITIPDSVTSIGEYAFYICSSLTSVEIGDSVTSIGDLAFNGCSSLTSIEIPEGVTSIGSGAFHSCTNLKSVEIGDSVTSIGFFAFYNCSSLTSITIPDSVTSIGNYAFEGCLNLTSITIPDSVTSIGDSAFSWCSSLTSVTIPDSVTSIGSGAFEYCSSLTSITIPDSVTSIGNEAFWGCSSLTSVTLLNPDTKIADSSYTINPAATIYGYAGSTAQAYAVKYGREFVLIGDIPTTGFIASGTCGKNLTWELTSDGTLTISGTGAMNDYQLDSTPWSSYDTSIKSVIIEDGVTSIGNQAFIGCSSLTSVTIGDSVTSIGSDAFSYCSSLTSVTIPDSVTSIGNYAFYICLSLTSVEIGDSVTSVGNYAFTGCSSLVNINVADRNLIYSDVGGILFNKNCTELICYPAGRTSPSYTIPDSVTSIGNWAFSYCSSLTSVTIPDSVTSIGSDAFWNCTNLTSITIPNSVISIGDFAFCGCSSLTSINIPDSVTSIGDYAFEDCSSLTSITIPDSVTSIGDYAFSYCTSLTSVTIPDSVTSIGGGAFHNCSSLTSITIPDSVTSICYDAFSGCSSLTSINIPDSVTSIDYEAFSDCSSLTNITLLNPDTEIYDSSYTINPTATIYGYAGSTAQAYAVKYGRSFVEIHEHTHIYGEWQSHDEDNHICYCTINDCDAFETADHRYDNDRDATCNDCGYTREVVIMTPEVVIADTVVNRGDEVILTVVLKNFENIDTLGLDFEYDTSVLKINEAKTKWLLKNGVISSFNFNTNQATFAGYDTFNPNSAIAQICFTVAENAPFENTTVTVGVKLETGTIVVYDDETYTTVSVIDVVPGDLNNDGNSDRNDAIHLLYASIFGEAVYPLNQECDYDGDGYLTRSDAIYLLYYSIFGAEDYPLI